LKPHQGRRNFNIQDEDGSRSQVNAGDGDSEVRDEGEAKMLIISPSNLLLTTLFLRVFECLIWIRWSLNHLQIE